MIIPRVPTLKSLAPRFNFKVRYQAATAAQTVIIVGDLLDSLAFVGPGTNIYRTLAAIRIKQVEMWGPMDATLAPAVIVVNWLANATATLFGGPAKLISDTSMGSAEVAYIKTSPPKGSLASQWFQDSSTPTSAVVEFGFPANAIIDILYEGVFNFDGLSHPCYTGVGLATAGAQYIRPLDLTGSAVLVPQVVAST
jgi:hypothetical protein